MKTELHKAERPHKKKSSRLSSERSQAIIPQPTPSNASLVPLPSSSSDDGDSPRYSHKNTVHSNVSDENSISGPQENSNTISLKSPPRAPPEKSAKKKKITKSSRHVSSAIKQERMPQNLENLHQMSSSDENSSPGKKSHGISSASKKGLERNNPSKKSLERDSPSKKGHERNSPKKKVRSVKRVAAVDTSMTHVDCQADTRTLTQTGGQADTHALTQTGGQADTGDQSDDSSGSSSLADSSSEDERPVPPAPQQQDGCERDEREDKEEDGPKTPKHIRFNAPEHYTECELQNKHLSQEDAANCDLWLIKVPYDFDVADMNKKCVTIGGVMMVKKTTEKDGEDRVWEMEAAQDDTLQASTWCVMLPSKTDNKFSPVGPLKGQICLTRRVPSLPCVLPPVPRKHVDMPQGLTVRNIPFGADAPLWGKSRRKRDRESGHGEVSGKKHRRRQHLEETESTADAMKEETGSTADAMKEETGSTADAMKEEPADWTTTKHHKKHKTHKRHSIKVER